MIAKNEDFIRRNIAGQKTKLAKSAPQYARKNRTRRSRRADRSQGNFTLKKIERAGNQVLTVEKLAVGYGE
jgi:ATP-binding cassette subfamily F protein 3